jgi:hypothetical protein
MEQIFMISAVVIVASQRNHGCKSTSIRHPQEIVFYEIAGDPGSQRKAAPKSK